MSQNDSNAISESLTELPLDLPTKINNFNYNSFLNSYKKINDYFILNYFLFSLRDGAHHNF